MQPLSALSEGGRKLACSRDEAAIALGISTSTVDRMVKRGDLAAFKLGQLTRIPLSELERLMREHRVSST
jgi:excisionase family DNA binding protein